MADKDATDDATRRTIAVLDELAAIWADEAGLEHLVAATVAAEDREQRVAALMKRAFMEGFFRAWLAARQ